MLVAKRGNQSNASTGFFVRCREGQFMNVSVIIKFKPTSGDTSERGQCVADYLRGMKREE